MRDGDHPRRLPDPEATGLPGAADDSSRNDDVN
jgi:hypothetical protein